MAIVLDRSDPNGQGMFSKAGRVTAAKYIVFQKKVEILNNQKKFIKVSSLPLMSMEQVSNPNPFKSLLEEEEEKSKEKEIKKISRKSEVTPFSRQLSRDQIDKIKGKKLSGPPTGFYNPKYAFIEKSSTILFNYNKENKRPRSVGRSRASSISVEESELSDIPKKQSKKIVGPIQFGFQTSRERFFKPANNPHEERFIMRDFPAAFSKMRRVPSYDMGRSSGRDQMTSREKPLPDYDPNYEIGKRGLGSSGLHFFKQLSRKPIEHKSYCMNDEFFDIDASVTLKFQKQKTVDFGKEISRDTGTSFRQTPFVTKANNSRYSNGMLSQRTMEINNISEGKLQRTFSLNASHIDLSKNMWKN